MEASSEDMGARREWWDTGTKQWGHDSGERETTRGHTWKDATRKGGGRIDMMGTFKGRLMWRRRRRVADDIWMMRKQEAT
jgi:hypothetical protein